MTHGKVDAGRIVRKREFGGESFAGSRRELEGGEIGDGGWGISSERGCWGKSGMGRGSEIGKEDEAADFERGEEESGSVGRQGEGKSWMQRRMGERGNGNRRRGTAEGENLEVRGGAVRQGRKMTSGDNGGAAVRRRLEDGGVAMTVEKNHGRGKEWRRSSRRRRRLDSFPGLP